MLTSREQAYCNEIAKRVEEMRALLNQRSLGGSEDAARRYKFLSLLHQTQGNLSNALHFVATRLAKRYLAARFQVQFDAAEKPQGAPGIDIDLTTSEGQRIIAEIKTTLPLQLTEFGAKQAESFKKDFAKLTSVKAEHKFLFVTEEPTFSVLKKPKYTAFVPGVKIVQLLTGEEHAA